MAHADGRGCSHLGTQLVGTARMAWKGTGVGFPQIPPVSFLPPAGFASVSGLASVGASHHGAQRKLGASKLGLSSAWLRAWEGSRRGDGGP